MHDPLRTALMLNAIDDAAAGRLPLTREDLREKASGVPWAESNHRLASAAHLRAGRVEELREWLRSWGVSIAEAPARAHRATHARLIEAGLGKASDTEVARRAGVSRQRAQQVRRLLGIPSYTTALRRSG